MILECENREEIDIGLLSMPKTHLTACGIYFLLYNKKIVYIGKTRRGYFRLFSHLKNKDWTDFSFIPCPEKYVDSVEEYYIEKFTPIYNIQKKFNGRKLDVREVTILKDRRKII